MLPELYLSPVAPFKAIHTFWYRYLTLMLGGRQGNVKSYCSQSFWHCDLLKLRYLTTQKQQIPRWAKQPWWHPWTQAEDKSHPEITALTCSHFSCQPWEMGYCTSHNPQQLMKNTQNSFTCCQLQDMLVASPTAHPWDTINAISGQRGETTTATEHSSPSLLVPPESHSRDLSHPNDTLCPMTATTMRQVLGLAWNNRWFVCPPPLWGSMTKGLSEKTWSSSFSH